MIAHSTRSFLFLLSLLLVSSGVPGELEPAVWAARLCDSDGDSERSLAQQFAALKFRNIGPFRGGRSNAVCGVVGDRLTYYFGGTGGGVWKTTDAGLTWKNVSDGFFKSGSVGAIAVAPSDPNVVYVGMGEHAIRGVMTSHGDGVYKSTDAGQTWSPIGLPDSRHIAAIRVHPNHPDHLFVAVQGAQYGPSAERGVYRSTDGGESWEQVLFVNETTGAADLSLDAHNPRILYAGMWDHQRTPWKIRSGGPGSGIHKSTDGGTTWKKLSGGLPDAMGKVAVDVSAANPEVVYANVEAEGKKGGVYRSDNGGKSWRQASSDRATVARAWYYIEIFADPVDADQVYVLNAGMLKSIDGGQNFTPVANPHSDQHDLWIHPTNSQNMILANDGGACISFNGGQTWSPQNNQPTAQFYRVITDRQFPYRLYAGQQDNSTVSIASRTIAGSIGEQDWFATAGGESAFLAFDPDAPDVVFGTSIQGILDRHDLATDERKSIVVYPQLNLGTLPRDQKYRFNWNGPLVAQVQDPGVLYTGGNILFRSDDGGYRWSEISPDLTRNEPDKQGPGSEPFTNEAAGGEVYNTISYIAVSPHRAGEIWVGTDDGRIQRTIDEGAQWEDVTPHGLEESLINAIELSPHDPLTAFAAVTRYKFNDLTPMAFKTQDGGKTWAPIVKGFADGHFVRVVRQDPVNDQILYAGTEGGLYVSFNQGVQWHPFQLNLPVCPITDLAFQDNDLVVATAGRAFWILDDLGAIQQSGGDLPADGFRMFQPKPAVKYASGGGSASPYAGQNPFAGVVVDYLLPADWDPDQSLVLEVLDGEDRVLRTFTSDTPKATKRWAGGPSPPTPLPAKPGLNRFGWDLRGEPIPGVSQVFVMGGHEGARVVPGQYRLRLHPSDDSRDPVEVVATVAADPRIEVEPEAYDQQRVALQQTMDLAIEIHETVNRFQRVKSQLAAHLAAIDNRPELTRLELVKGAQAAGKQALQELRAWEQQLIQRKQKTFQDVINFRNQLNAELTFLRGQLDTNHPRPTQGVRERLEELAAQWTARQQELDSIVNGSLQQFNAAWQGAELPPVIIPAEEDN